MNLKKGNMFGDAIGHIYAYVDTLCADSAMAELRVFDVISGKFVEKNFLATDFAVAGYRMFGQ